MKLKIKKVEPKAVKFSDLLGGEFYVLSCERYFCKPVIRMKLMSTQYAPGFVIKEWDGSHGTAIHNCIVFGGIGNGCLGANSKEDKVYPVEVEMSAEYIY